MHAITHESIIYTALTISEAMLQFSAYRALNKEYENNRSMTPMVKDTIITALMILEDHISAAESIPELPQKIYDAFTYEEEMNIF